MVLARIIEWQLAHPNGSKDECTSWLATERDEGRIVTEDLQARGSTAKRGKNAGSVAKKVKR